MSCMARRCTRGELVGYELGSGSRAILLGALHSGNIVHFLFFETSLRTVQSAGGSDYALTTYGNMLSLSVSVAKSLHTVQGTGSQAANEHEAKPSASRQTHIPHPQISQRTAHLPVTSVEIP